MKRVILNVLLGAVMIIFFSAYGSGNEMTSIFKGREVVTIDLVGHGMVTIDWGNGSKEKTYRLEEGNNSYSWKYAQTLSRTIKIIGENITELYCSEIGLTNLDISRSPALTILKCYGNQLTNLDVTKNTMLVELNCTNNQLTNLDISNNLVLEELFCGKNKLTSLDVTKNIVLTKYLSVYKNQLSTEALNALFGALSNEDSGTIFIRDNPGTNTCDQSIATKKKWIVNVE